MTYMRTFENSNILKESTFKIGEYELKVCPSILMHPL